MKNASPAASPVSAPPLRLPRIALARWLTGWRLAAFLVSLVTLVPLVVVLSSFLYPQSEVWNHLAEHVLPDILLNTLWLSLGVAFGTGVLGVTLAWLTAVCEFPGRRFFAWALMLPLAMPAYVTAFVAIGLLDFTGPLQTLLREWFGSSAWFPRIRSRGGVILVMSLALYPYVYLLARNAFMTQGRRALEAGQSLGLSRRMGFVRIALPMARPWIVAGIMLVLMETLADFGTVAIFNYDTFTTAIYKAWFGLFSLSTASQLASILVLIVFALVATEQRWRGARRYQGSGRSQATTYRLKPALGWTVSLLLGLFFCATFAIPLTQLVVWSASVFAEEFDARYPMFIWHSVLLSAIAAVLVVVAGLILSYALRVYRDWPTRFFARLSTLGYAVPGTVLAVGIFIPVAWLDNRLLAWLPQLGGSGGSVLKGTLTVMLLAYVARFLAPGFNAIDSAMQRITRSQEEAARGMGLYGWRLLAQVHVPLLRGGLLTAALMVFVDVMKEMPITLMTRPFGWDTLAVRVFEMTSEGQWELAALPAVVLVLVGLLPVMLLTRQSGQ
ncbi:ABC transporter permease [Noviherbaspirillum sedimenti]|uniref:Iron ABC transporter permease n=1 Tax=Noviherbaspirillum sedimenti TaxID=2320865 RepID=A0A3A3G2N9_9BURK|nr:iron ABC transporter permease [Noviherbaspirillum sedimenti]RJG02201.1 iron ABC transporter permease [Noviherbaspirillum sedimenti]